MHLGWAMCSGIVSRLTNHTQLIISSRFVCVYMSTGCYVRVLGALGS